VVTPGAVFGKYQQSLIPAPVNVALAPGTWDQVRDLLSVTPDGSAVCPGPEIYVYQYGEQIAGATGSDRNRV